MSLLFIPVHSCAYRGRWSNLRAVCSTVGLYCITITWQQIFKCSLQVTVESVLLHVTVEKYTSGQAYCSERVTADSGKQCCHFWWFNIRSDVLREISDVWCFSNKSDVDWAIAFFLNFLSFSHENKSDSWFFSFFHQFLTLNVCLVIVPNCSSFHSVGNNITRYT